MNANSKTSQCSHCGVTWTGKPRLCGRCKSVVYCSRACQTTCWERHKQTCKKVKTRPTSKNRRLAEVVQELDVILAAADDEDNGIRISVPCRTYLQELKKRVLALNTGRTPLDLGSVEELKQWRQGYKGVHTLLEHAGYNAVIQKLQTVKLDLMSKMLEGVHPDVDQEEAVVFVRDVLLPRTIFRGTRVPAMLLGADEPGDPIAGISFPMGSFRYAGSGNAWYKQYIQGKVPGHFGVCQDRGAIDHQVRVSAAQRNFWWFWYDDSTKQYEQFDTLASAASFLAQLFGC